MKKRYWIGGLAALVVIGGAVTAYTLAPTVHEGSLSELPELARAGDYSIATTTADINLPDRPVITATSTVTGTAEPAPRTLKVRFWYPTSTTEGNIASYERDISRDANNPLPIVFKGKAIESAEAITDSRFPLVVMSHGYGGWAEHTSFLGEHIASRGYVVASINHADPRPDGAISFVLSFGHVLQNRALDQQQIIDHLLSQATKATSGYAAAINPEKVGLIGYSMGGYGAFRTAGATYDYDGKGLSNLPTDSKIAMQASTFDSSRLGAMIALAPWGGAPDNRSWTPEGLAKLRVPSLLISGNQDDVVGFDDGVVWLFEGATGSNRHLLVYREARHNIAGNAITDPGFPANQDFATAEYIREPVWRTERINAINQHFITAFLDLHLKGDTAKLAYLEPPTENSNDSQWQLSFGEQLNGKLASAEEKAHWRGFQRRWALGMEMHAKKAGE